jgi:hypothetical protein
LNTLKTTNASKKQYADEISCFHPMGEFIFAPKSRFSVGRAYLPDIGPLKIRFRLTRLLMSGKYARPTIRGIQVDFFCPEMEEIKTQSAVRLLGVTRKNPALLSPNG